VVDINPPTSSALLHDNPVMKLASMENEDLLLVLLAVAFAAIMLVAGELILTTRSEPAVPPAHRVPSETSSHNNLPATHVAFRLWLKPARGAR
jgi:hypothetical protein